MGGSLTVGIQDPLAVDPALAADPSGLLVASAICDPLIQTDPKTGELKPGLAKSWLVTEDGRKITITLNQKSRFHDGSEVTAQDAIFALNRVADLNTASPFAQLLKPIEGFDEVRGEGEAQGEAQGEGRPQKTGLEAPAMSGLVAQEKYNFEITLTRPNADFLKVLTTPLSSPVPQKKANSDAFSARPVCTGPYRPAKAWKPGAPSIKVTRFKDYHSKSVGFSRGGPGYADEIDFRVLADYQAEYAEFQAGKLDVAHVPEDKMAEARQKADALVQGPHPSFEYIGLPVETPPFDNPAVRRALSRALDRTALVNSVYQGTRAPARGFLPESLGRIHRKAGCGANAPATADLEGAKAVLAKAGVDLNGKTAKIYFNDEFGHRAVVEAVAGQWRQNLGFNAEPTALVWDQYLSLGMRPGGYDGPFRMSWQAEYPSGERMLAPLFEDVNIPSTNLTRFNSRFFNVGLAISREDKLLDRKTRQVRAADDEGDRRLEYQFLEDHLCSQMPAIPLDFGRTSLVVNPTRVDSAIDAFTHRTTGHPLLRELFLKRP